MTLWGCGHLLKQALPSSSMAESMRWYMQLALMIFCLATARQVQPRLPSDLLGRASQLRERLDVLRPRSRHQRLLPLRDRT